MSYVALRLPSRDGRLSDLGASDWPSTPVDTPTCFPPGSMGGARRDACIATTTLRARVLDFVVDPQASVFVHRPVSSQFRVAWPEDLGVCPRVPEPLEDLKGPRLPTDEWKRKCRERQDVLLGEAAFRLGQGAERQDATARRPPNNSLIKCDPLT